MEPTAGAPGLGTPGLSGSSRSWGSSFRQQGLQADTDDPFRRGSASSSRRHDDEEENLRWAALEKLPTYDRMRRAILLGVGGDHHLQGVAGLVEIEHLASGDGGLELLERVFQDDSEQFLRSLRDRVDRVGIEFPAIEVRYQDLSIEVDAIVGSSALPTLWNATTNFLQSLIGRLASSNKKTINILQNVNGILKPSRMTLLLGPPSSGKSTLMRALTGKLDKSLKVSGSITYCGHTFSEFYPERTSAYVSQYDLHNAEMTVRETLDFSRRCLGVGARYDLLAELAKRERDAGIKPDPAIDAYMKATAVQGQETNIVTYLTLKVLGLDICADTMIGDDMVRGISGGQKKRVTTGEMLTGPARALFMDEISTGLDSSSTFQIVKYVKQLVHVMNETVMISLLQPPPETYNLFDDIILISEGYIVYHGPRENILEFFESSGFRCPERKGVADFLQEVTSKKDQQQYWYREQEQYRHVSVPEFAERFKSFHVGQQMLKEMQIPFEKSKTHPAALTTKKYGISSKESLKAVMSREMLLMKRNSFIYIFKVSQLIIIGLMAMTVFLRTKMPSGQISDGGKFFGALTFSLITILFNGFAELQLTIKVLPTFYKQRDLLFFPPWTFGLANILLKVPVSLLEAGVWVILTYFVMGFAPSVGRDSQQDLFNLLGATYAAVFFLGASNCFIVQPVVAIERTVFYREKAAGMYSPLSYALAQTSVEVIYNSLQGCLYTIIIYSMVGYEWKADKFLYFLFFIISSFNYFTLFGMMLVALTPSAMLANILTSFVMPLWNLFAGFLVVRMAIPIWWRWYYWADPVAWTIYGVVASQFGESAGTISVPAGASFGEEIPARCSGSAARFPWLHCARPLCLRDCLLLRVRLFHQVLNFQKR
ncbi:hypothetical protein ACQ4PT_070564 [Festuca glaucescens]